jgi:hypothetical protein
MNLLIENVIAYKLNGKLLTSYFKIFFFRIHNILTFFFNIQNCSGLNLTLPKEKEPRGKKKKINKQTNKKKKKSKKRKNKNKNKNKKNLI